MNMDWISTAARTGLLATTALEGAAALQRFGDRKSTFDLASKQAKELGRTLVVVGAPRAGAHTRLIGAYGCGDVCVDIVGCGDCVRSVQHDITSGPVPGVPDDSSVVFVSCVLEYVSDPQAAWRDLLRMAGDPSRVHIVRVQPWTFTAALYPGAKWLVSRDGFEPPTFLPVTNARRVGSIFLLAGTAAMALAK
jgi:hypothetical protein